MGFFNDLWGGIKNGVADLVTQGGYSANIQNELNQQTMQREDNAYLRTVQDMNNAGLSPLAMNGTNGASAMTAGNSDSTNKLMSTLDTISNFAKVGAEIGNINAETNLINSQKEATDSQTEGYDLDNAIKRANKLYLDEHYEGSSIKQDEMTDFKKMLTGQLTQLLEGTFGKKKEEIIKGGKEKIKEVVTEKANEVREDDEASDFKKGVYTYAEMCADDEKIYTPAKAMLLLKSDKDAYDYYNSLIEESRKFMQGGQRVEAKRKEIEAEEFRQKYWRENNFYVKHSHDKKK